jgi:hypothetical protein
MTLKQIEGMEKIVQHGFFLYHVKTFMENSH